MAEKLNLSFILFVMTGCIIFESVNSATHIVGGKVGWNLPSYYGFFEDWSKNQTFIVGDQLRMSQSPSIFPPTHSTNLK